MSSVRVFGVTGLAVAVAAITAAARAKGEKSCTLNGVPVPGRSVATLDAKRFQALHRAVTPKPNAERWTEIPWQPDLVAARQKAAREQKPLLMWIMDGHPLGCT